MPYHIGHFEGIKAKIQHLADQAEARGIRKAYLNALSEIITNLRTRPLEWAIQSTTLTRREA